MPEYDSDNFDPPAPVTYVTLHNLASRNWRRHVLYKLTIKIRDNPALLFQSHPARRVIDQIVFSLFFSYSD